MAAFGAINVAPGYIALLGPDTKTEYRGLSFVMGGDSETVSVANYIKRYNPLLYGPSKGNHTLDRFDFPNSTCRLLIISLRPEK